jgi:hypothetical protein
MHSLPTFEARVIQWALHRIYSAFEQMIAEFSTNGAQPAEQNYPSVFHKLRMDLSAGYTRHCEEPLRRSNPVLLVARVVWIASLRSQ